MAGLTDSTFSLPCLSWVWGLWNSGHTVAHFPRRLEGHETVAACTPSFPEEQRMQRRPHLPKWPFLAPKQGSPIERGPGWESELMPGPGGVPAIQNIGFSILEFFAVPARPPCLQKVTFWTEHCSWLWATPWPLPPPHPLPTC